jgi:hypothetical protein
MDSSTETEYNEAFLAFQSTSHLHTMLNDLEQVEPARKDNKPVDIFSYNKSAVDMSV